MANPEPDSVPPDPLRTRGPISITLPITAAGFVISTLTYGCALWLVLHSRAGVAPTNLSGTLRMAGFGVAGLALVGAIFWTRLRVTPLAEGNPGDVGPIPSPAGVGAPGALCIGFQREVTIALAIAEVPAIIGLMLGLLGGTMQEYVYLAVPSLAVMALVIMPQIFRFLNRP